MVAFDELQQWPLEAEGSVCDMIMLIARNEDRLPPAVCQWLLKWLREAHAHSTIVCLIGSSDGAYRESAIWHGLHNACGYAGVAFFAAGFSLETEEPRQAADFIDVTQNLPEGVMHWGINE